MSSRRKFMESNGLKKNKSSRFILAMYGLAVLKNSHVDYYLINTYYDKDDYFYVIFDNDSNDKLQLITYTLRNDPNYIETFYDDTSSEVVLKMRIPEEFKDDYNLFKEGKYTKFSRQFKDLLGSLYGRVSSRKERTKNGMPMVKVFDAINPTKEKYEDIANYYGVDIKDIMIHGEIMDPPDDKEMYKSVKELYGVKQ